MIYDMKTYLINIGGHIWEKQNIITQGVKRAYDVYKCRKCGITGKSYSLGMITIRESDVKKFQKCKQKLKLNRIMVTNCKAFGTQFANIKPGTKHDIVPPPPGEDNKRGEWVMGVSEPVLLLAGEFIYIEKE